MASPPFSLNISAPGNSDVAAVFPALDRTDKDVIQSWFLVSMNTQGRNATMSLDKVGTTYGPVSAPTPGANVASMYYDSDNNYKVNSGDIGIVEILGVPPGTVITFAGSSAPAGYLVCGGQAISRTTYARLFAVIGTLYGSGDGSTTFNVPDLRGRTAYGLDNMGGTAANRIVLASGNMDGTIMGNAGGNQVGTVTLTQGELPNVTLPVTSITVVDPGHGHALNFRNTLSDGGANYPSQKDNGGNNLMNSSANTTTSITSPYPVANNTSGITLSGNVPLGGSGTPVPIVANAMIMLKCIKI